ncbi:MAG: ABC transporter permease [Hyphomicrobiales bacterium]
MLWEAIKLAVTTIRRNVLRSILTLLGVVIGVGAVIAMVTIGNGATVKVKDDLGKLGTNLLVVVPGQSPMGGGLRTNAPAFKEGDVEAMRQQMTGVQAVAPTSRRQIPAIFGTQNWSTAVTGTDNAYFTAQNWQIADGREFNDGELRSGKAACIIGETVRKELFGPLDPVGERIRLKTISCEVVGLLKAKGQSSFGTDQDNTILVPLRMFQRRISGNTDVDTISVSAANGVDTATVQADIEALMRERRKIGQGEDDNFYVRDLRQVIQTMTATTAIMTGLLGAVAAVSLVVGGIGIMNIMLVSVTERTREIGIRLAIGALERQVLLQFLIEAIVLSLIGGLIGIAIGLSIAGAVTWGLGVPFMLSPGIIGLAFFFSLMVGVVFGFFPARRAARLDPIQALRHE